MTDAADRQLTPADMRTYLHTLQDRLPMFTVTDHPTDWPDFYVARLSLTLPEVTLMPLTIMDPDLDRLRAALAALGLMQLNRYPEDDPVIVEVWL